MYTGVGLNEIFGDQVRKIVVVEGVSKCVIFDVDSILGVEILSENFSRYTAVVGLGTSRCEGANQRFCHFRRRFAPNLRGRFRSSFHTL